MARILVADDNRPNLDLMLYLLRAFGHDAEGTEDGNATLQAAESGGFDLILSDVLMPGIDGYELARRVRANAAISWTPLLAVTALAMVGDRERVLAAGFDGYLSKPIDAESFVPEIDSYLPPEKRSRAPAT